MIIYNEKAEEDDQQQLSVLDPTAKTSPAAPPLPNHASPISSVDSRLGAGLLHQYLQIYKDQLDQGRVQMPVPHRQNSDETAVDVEATGVPLDEPPPYTSEDALLSKCHALPKSPIQSPRSPSPPYQPVAGPSNSNHHHSTTPRTGDIDATWTFDDSDLDEDSTMIGPELDPEDAASAVSACGCKSFETLRGDITLHLKIPNRHSRKRRKVQIITHCGSIDVTLVGPPAPGRGQAANFVERRSRIPQCQTHPRPYPCIYTRTLEAKAISPSKFRYRSLASSASSILILALRRLRPSSRH